MNESMTFQTAWFLKNEKLTQQHFKNEIIF